MNCFDIFVTKYIFFKKLDNGYLKAFNNIRFQWKDFITVVQEKIGTEIIIVVMS